MSEQPDLSTLPKRMVYAATVAVEASMRRWGIETGLWSAGSFIDYADVFDRYDSINPNTKAAGES